MSAAIEGLGVIAANMAHAARNLETVVIGAGEFGPAELMAASKALHLTPVLVALISQLYANAGESPKWFRERIEAALAGNVATPSL